MGRKSTGEYPPDWPQISHQIKVAAGWKCVRCGHVDDRAAGYMLTVHHLDLNKSNCEWWNCASLCQRCHLRIQGRVIMERPYMFEHTPWFRPYVAGYYAAQNGHPTDRAWVEAHLEEMLDYGRPAPRAEAQP